MAVDTFDELFQPQSMAGLVRRYADQSSQFRYLNVYRSGEKLFPEADSVSWDEVEYSRDIASLTGPDSPSNAARKTKTTKKSGVLIDVKEHVDLPARWLFLMRQPGTDMADAPSRVTTELQNLTNRCLKAANYVAARSMLTTNGAVDLSAVPNSKLTGTLTFPVGTSGSLASWATDTTKLRSSEINALKKDYARASGLKAATCIASDAIEKYITQNTEVTKFITEGSLAARMLTSSFQDGGGVASFGGLEWNFGDDYYAAQATPDTPAAVNADTDIFTVLPAQADWNQAFGWAEGKVYVPAGPIAAAVQGAPSALISEMRGFYAYVELMTAPVGLRLHVGMRFLPIQKIQKAAYVFNSTP